MTDTPGAEPTEADEAEARRIAAVRRFQADRGKFPGMMETYRAEKQADDRAEEADTRARAAQKPAVAELWVAPSPAVVLDTWRTHVIRPGRPCMRCNRQLDLAQAIPDKQGLLDDPSYIARAGNSDVAPPAQNVAPLSASVSAGLLAQYVSLSAAPAGLGDPGPLQYSLNTHFLDHRDDQTKQHCQVESDEAAGDHRLDLTDRHPCAEHQRRQASPATAKVRLLRWLDDRAQALITRLDHT